MTDLLKTYENTFRKYEDKIFNNFNQISLTIKSNPSLQSEINNLLEQNEKLINEQSKVVKQMDIELSSLKGDTYEQFSAKISSFRKTLDMNKKKLNKLSDKVDDKNSFMSENNLLGEDTIKNEKSLFKNKQKLQEVQRVLISTEDIGNNIMVDMDGQTKGMKNVSGKLKHINKDIDESNNVIGSMKFRKNNNKKMISTFVIILLVLFIGVIAYRVLKK